MSFWQKLQAGLYRFMQGRNGVDHLGWAALVGALIINVVNLFIGSILLSLVSTAMYGYSLFRMLSRNRGKRSLENQRYVAWSMKWKQEARELFQRVKNLPRYKYFRCPQCAVRLRMKRGGGEKQIRCPKCQHAFTKKA